MIAWTPLQYNGAWDEIYSQCSEDIDALATLDSRLDQLLDRGNLARRPVSAHLEDGIFELRAKKARVLFYFGAERTIVFVHGFIKDTPKVPREDIEIAKKRRQDIISGKESLDDL